MRNKIHPTPPLGGGYELEPFENIDIEGVTWGAVGIANRGGKDEAGVDWTTRLGSGGWGLTTR